VVTNPRISEWSSAEQLICCLSILFMYFNKLEEKENKDYA